MKVAIIAFYVMDSTIPLAKHIALAGVEVDLYSLLPQRDQNAFVFDFLSNKQKNGFVKPEVIKTTLGEKLMKYLHPVNTNIFIYPNVNGRFRKYLFQDFFQAYKLAKHLKKGKYDLIHILHSDEKFWNYLYFFLNKRKIIQTLHEVTSHESETPKKRMKQLIYLINNSIPLIFNSNISMERFISFRKTITDRPLNEGKLEMIRFGLYETYQCFSRNGQEFKSNDKITILNFGRIVPYKGIRFLVEAVKILQSQYPIHLVVAGDGTPDFDFKGIKDFEFINRVISNEEIVRLIEGSDVVVLPYTSASQSGVVMTVYALNKPIVASNVDGLKEVIDHMQTGILVDNLNGERLASSLEIILKNRELGEKMRRNIKKKYSEAEFSWKFIADKTIMVYKRNIEHNKRDGSNN
jgi:glycosyltransferase involved in cell wall biosynthesis